MDKGKQRARFKETAPIGEANAPLAERIRALQNRILARPPTGKEADKDFFDWLSGDE